MKGDAIDPKGLIADAYRIEGIRLEECRTIFLDWALSVPVDVDTGALIAVLLERHGGEADHPMTAVLDEGLTKITAPNKRRGGVRGRRSES
ncbi:MAG: hypothetical protein ACRBB0_14305 [Pelagimonas sp.]|uniref:hypothetical protein n=1 Tax=Pelagimonas sp. TaxID=2073170 RepID=UPI003D6AE308